MKLNQDTYEVWIERTGHKWSRATVDDEDIWTDRKEAEEIAETFTKREGVLKIIVIERRPIVFLNGPVESVASKSKPVKPSQMIQNLE